MLNIEELLHNQISTAIKAVYNIKEVNSKMIQIQRTRKEFDGDFTVVVFPLLRLSKKRPEQTAEELGEYLKNYEHIENYNVIKGFLNLTITKQFWFNALQSIQKAENFGFTPPTADAPKIVIEYSSPNTNKPLHLGHIRNNLLGYSIAEILKAAGKNIVKVNLINDRGIHICKTMLAWEKWGDGKTPKDLNIKGDHYVGSLYVRFESEYKKEISKLIEEGNEKEFAQKNAPLMLQAQEMLRQWEAGNKETRQLWEMMNGWVYAGFDVTYKALGVNFDKVYYESNTYKKGRNVVLDSVAHRYNWLTQRADKSIWADLTSDRLDEKILLRSDGTSVYMTQDIGTAIERYKDFDFDEHIYVVGNEQDYHFKVLAIVLKRLGYDWAKRLNHLSYGMVELPQGKMKSREGKVVDADHLIEEMIETARKTSLELGKLDELSNDQANEVFRKVALGALKYFILRVDPKRKMLFNPEESIDFNGNTGPFIQYTYVRILSMLRKAENETNELSVEMFNLLNKSELGLIQQIYRFRETIAEAAENHSPATIANYVYELTKEYNQFYHDCPVLKEENADLRNFRIALSRTCAQTIKKATGLLGMEVPEKM